MMNAIELSLFSSRIESVCDEMGALLQRSAFSPNIRDRLDYSCAVFDARGSLCAQAAHIPVHLGSMAFAMANIVDAVDWQPGDQLILNDPFLGGTHLPDVTLIAPVYVEGACIGFVANRAHHADIGATSPGSMPLSNHLEQEGILISPQKIATADGVNQELLDSLVSNTRNATDAMGDFSAQMGCNARGAERLNALVSGMGVSRYESALDSLNDYAEGLARKSLSDLPQEVFRFSDVMESDGQGGESLPLTVSLRWNGESLDCDFTGTASQVSGNINCPLSVTAAGVYFAVRCLLPDQAPACAGTFRCINMLVPEGSLLNAQRPAAVAAGNVETSTRVADVVLGALAKAVPEKVAAASQGTMNNLAFGADGAKSWGYYETMGGGMGASAAGQGASAIQSHMTNTRNTPVEVLELRYPMQVLRYQVRRGSGGDGLYRGGDGLVREFRFNEAAHCTFLTERRQNSPWGISDGEDGVVGRNLHNGIELPAKCELSLAAGDTITVETPGGGGYGKKR